MKKQIQISVSDATTTAKGFIDGWKRAEFTYAKKIYLFLFVLLYMPNISVA